MDHQLKESEIMRERLDTVLTYHQATKHHFRRFARGPGYLDWATQPDPFRRYRGAPVIPLVEVAPDESPPYDSILRAGRAAPVPLNLHSISQLFYDSLAVSAWKQAGDVRWALRVNPSSGNLHPTEGYLLCGPVPNLTETPIVAHYTPREHALEVRAEFPLETWQTLVADLPLGSVLVGLSSIHWREAWKYGERAFRYCQHDVGHAIAALSLAAAGLGWQATLLDDLGSAQISGLLGLGDADGAEPEHPDCLLAVYPQGHACPPLTPPAAIDEFGGLSWQGEPNRLSARRVSWPIIDEVAAATEKPPTSAFSFLPGTGDDRGPTHARPPSPPLRQIVRQRRSAVAMDGQGRIDRDTFYRLLDRTLPGSGRVPFNALPWPAHVHLCLFVHRVEGVPPGLYTLIRNSAQLEALRAEMKSEFAWQKPPACPPNLELYGLLAGDVQAVARQLSCGQEIAADGCFSLGMISAFEGPLERWGPWFYRRLFWECGAIGQVLYLEAEAAGMRGTGIGCFFDDPVHEMLGLGTWQYQSLYHFTVGYAVQDSRLTTLPAYPPPE